MRRRVKNGYNGVSFKGKNFSGGNKVEEIFIRNQKHVKNGDSDNRAGVGVVDFDNVFDFARGNNSARGGNNKSHRVGRKRQHKERIIEKCSDSAVNGERFIPARELKNGKYTLGSRTNRAY